MGKLGWESWGSEGQLRVLPPPSMLDLLDPRGRRAVSLAEITIPLAWVRSHHMFIVVSIIRLNLQGTRLRF